MFCNMTINNEKKKIAKMISSQITGTQIKTPIER